MSYQPFVSQISRGLVRGWKCQISGVEYTTTDPREEDAKYRLAADHSIRLQNVMDRTEYSAAAIEATPNTSAPTHKERNLSLKDRQSLYLSESVDYEAAVTATVGAE